MANGSQQLAKLSGRSSFQLPIPINTYLKGDQHPRDDEEPPLVTVVLTLHLLNATLEE